MANNHCLLRLRSHLLWLALPLLGSQGPAVSPPAVVIDLSAGDDIGRALSSAPPGAMLRLGAGEYRLQPHPFTEPTCGNCEDPDTRVKVSVGLVVSGHDIAILGAGADSTIIRTGAGYGILFDGCRDCRVENVTVTGGVRDRDGNATDAGIVVKNSRVTIRGCTIADNIGDTGRVRKVVVGIMGIAGREGSEIRIEGNRIQRNSWDGIALYRGARAVIENNVIDGVDRARGEEIGGGRGVGIGVTWDGRAEIRGNLVRNYWKGIGLFVDADAVVEENIVEHMLTWGVSLWDAGKGKPRGRIRHNAIHDTGACGVAIVLENDDDPEPGYFSGNAIVKSGQSSRYDSGEPYCLQQAIARHAVPAAFAIEGNVLLENREPGDALGMEDLPRVLADPLLDPLVERLQEWSALWGSDFLIRFGR